MEDNQTPLPWQHFPPSELHPWREANAAQLTVQGAHKIPAASSTADLRSPNFARCRLAVLWSPMDSASSTPAVYSLFLAQTRSRHRRPSVRHPATLAVFIFMVSTICQAPKLVYYRSHRQNHAPRLAVRRNAKPYGQPM
jgi:hypothetical protein